MNRVETREAGADEPALMSAGRSTNANGNRISVDSLWKVFGSDPEQAMTTERRGHTKSEIQEELGAIVALKDVTFDVPKGETFVVMGLSGSGKSTLVRCLIRLIEPSAGAIRVDGENVCEYNTSQLTQFRRHKTAMVFQHFGLLPHRTIIDNAAWGLEIQGINKQQRLKTAQETLEMVGLKGWENAFAGELSGGMQQRVGLARALAVDPEILLMDEPFSALDPLIRREMQDEMILLQQRLQKTIVFITHDLDEALKLGDRIAIMRDGEIVQLGAPLDIVENPSDDYVKEFIRDVSKTKVLGAGSIADGGCRALGTQNPRAALELMQADGARFLFVQDPSNNLLGVLTADQVVRAAQSNAGSLQSLDLGTSALFPRVSPDVSIDELIPLSAGSECPIAVVDDKGRLQGVVTRAALLASLAANQNTRT